MNELDNVVACCGSCGGAIYFVTCEEHEWVLASICERCFDVHFIEGGCPDCVAPSA